jgi:arylsulfatase A-like enzyme
MKSRFFLALFAFAQITSAQSNRTGHAAPPNILILLADQWRAQAFGYAGDPNVHTPRIDALSRQSVNLRNAISSVPVCSPMRASLLTGQRALTHGVFLNDVPLASDAVTLAKVLGLAGYDTAYVGKWHLNGDGRSAFIPAERRQGFTYWKVLECTHSYSNSAYYAYTPDKLGWQGYDAFAQTRDAQQYLRAHAKSDRPFLFILAWGPPHNPYELAPAEYRARYDPAKLVLRANVPKEAEAQARRDLAGYYAHCTALDDCVGDLLQTLHDCGLEKNTMVVFTSDHGDMIGSHGLARKQKPYDESIRVPLLIRWPAKLQPRELDAVFSSEDFMPTLLALCNQKLPKTVEGRDYSALLLAEQSTPGVSDPVNSACLISCPAPFGEWERRNGGKEYRGIRTSRYTYVRDLNGPWLLFDNETDPFQTTNLVHAASSSALAKQLDNLLTRKLRQAHDDFLPSTAYIKKWGYMTTSGGTVPYTN